MSKESYNPFSLNGKRILVTGASSGIGRAIAIECSRMGAQVLITARNEVRLAETISMMDGSENAMYTADLTDDSQIEALTEFAGNIDGLVNCAGVISHVPFRFNNRNFIDSVMEVNFFAPTILTQNFIKRKQLNKNASVVFISSISGGMVSAIGIATYSASKGAIAAMSKSLALELAPRGIRVNCISSGMVETAIMKEGMVSYEQLEKDRLNYPLGRYGKPDDIAWTAVYLLSDATAWMTGSNIIIDGGYTCI